MNLQLRYIDIVQSLDVALQRLDALDRTVREVGRTALLAGRRNANAAGLVSFHLETKASELGE